MENTQPTQLTLADLANIHNILEAACNRGAFRAQELTAVGTMYDKLTKFLEASSAPAGQPMSGPADTTGGQDA
jgi:hypothetical protein